MKSLILSLITLAAFNASAANLGGRADFTQVNIQDGTELAKKNVTAGSVSVETRGRGQITIKLQPAFFCPAQMVCAQVMPQALEYTVELQSITTGGCGETIYVGVSDQRPVDGLRTEIRVTDHATDTCEYLIANGTEVVLKIDGGRPAINEQHEFFSKDFLKENGLAFF